MARFKTVKKEFVSIPNSVVQGFYLTANELAVLITCLSYPHNWEYRPLHIWRSLGISRDKTYAAFEGLVEKGHCIRIKHKRGNLIAEVDYIFFDEIQFCHEFVKDNAEEFLGAYSVEHKWNFKKCSRHPEIQDTEGQHPEGGESDSQEVLKKEVIKEDLMKEEQQQPAALAAVFSSHEQTKQEQPSLISDRYAKQPITSVIYSSLAAIAMPQADKEWLCKNYSQEVVDNAVLSIATTEIKTCLAKYVKWACKQGIKPPEPVEDRRNALREKLKPCDNRMNKSQTVKIEVFNSRVEFIFPTCRRDPDCVSFDSENAEAEITSRLKLYGFVS